MLTLFKKKQQPIVSNEFPQESFSMKGKSLIEIVHQIHHEFDGAGENFLATLKEHLALQIPSDDELSVLKKCGFENSPAVKAMIDEKFRVAKLKDEAALFNQAMENHPKAFKVLTSQQIGALCKKWGLEFNSVVTFIKEVPKKNIKEIELYTASLTQYRSVEVGPETLYVAATPDCLEHKLAANYTTFTLIGHAAGLSNIIKDDPLIFHVLQTQDLRASSGNRVTKPVLFGLVTAWGPEAEEVK